MFGLSVVNIFLQVLVPSWRGWLPTFSGIRGVVEEVVVVLKVLVVVDILEKRCLSFLIWVFLYCRVSFLFSVEVNVLQICEGLAIKFLLQRCLGVTSFSLEMVDLDIGTHDSVVDEWIFGLPYYGLFRIISFPFDLQNFWHYCIGLASLVTNFCSSTFGKLSF